MPNSATLVQAILAAFCAILCALSSLGGGGMMVGARTAAWAKSGGWVNPYVTDGLIAMWDGLNNQGPGIQVQNPSTWIDVVGGKVWTPCAGMSFAEDHWTNNWYDDGKPTFDVQFASTAENLTIESVFTIFDIDSNNRFPFRFIYNDGIYLNFISTSMGVNSFYGSNSRAYIDQSLPTHVAITPTQVFKNGVKTWEGLTYDKSIVSIKWPGHGAINRHLSAMWALRCYNRTLSEEEVAANYEIDKARFNLT